MTALAHPVPDATADDASLKGFVDAVVEAEDDTATTQRAEMLSADVDADRRTVAEVALRLTDLTTLEGTDTPQRVRDLCERALRPDPEDDSCPQVAAVCVYSDLAGEAAAAVAGSDVRVAAVAGSFPAGRAPLSVRVADVEAAVAAGADEIDAVIDRGALLERRYADVTRQVAALKAACGDAKLKMIIELSELPTLAHVRIASWLSLVAGADVVKTSTGKGAHGATLPGTLAMLEVALDYERATGRHVGLKAAGGVRTTDEAGAYLALVAQLAGTGWWSPDRFRFGASSLLADLVAARR